MPNFSPLRRALAAQNPKRSSRRRRLGSPVQRIVKGGLFQLSLDFLQLRGAALHSAFEFQVHFAQFIFGGAWDRRLVETSVPSSREGAVIPETKRRHRLREYL